VQPWYCVPSRISDIPQLLAAIESRLAEIAAEISALDAAKAPRRPGGQGPAITTDATATCEWLRGRSLATARPTLAAT
jgi:hypothetical protein